MTSERELVGSLNRSGILRGRAEMLDELTTWLSDAADRHPGSLALDELLRWATEKIAQTALETDELSGSATS